MTDDRPDFLPATVLLATAVPAAGPLPDPGPPEPLTADAIRAAVRRVLDAPDPGPPVMVVHPRTHDRACDLLGLPHGSPITQADAWRAAEIELDAMPADRRDAVLAECWAIAARGW